MLFRSLLVVLAAPVLVFSKIVFGGVHYNGNGTVTVNVKEYSDAPSTFTLQLSNSSGNKTAVQSVQATPGTYLVTLPYVGAGSYSLVATDASGAVLSKSPAFTVGAADYGSATNQAGTYAVVSTGTIIPFLAATTEVVGSSTIVTSVTVYGPGQIVPTVSASSVSPVASVVNMTSGIVTTSGTVTMTIPTIIASTGTVTPTPVTVPVSVTAATATATSSQSGAGQLKASGLLAVLGGVAACAFFL